MKPHNSLTLPVLFCLAWAASFASAATLTPHQLEERLAAGEALLIVDVRSNLAYQQAHIPGAIHVPMHVLPHKTLPSSRSLVVYGDGLGRVYGEDAQEILSASGHQVEVLEGGFSAWVTQTGRSTNVKGFQESHTPPITYQSLVTLRETNIVLTDLRSSQRKSADDPLAQLHQQLPAARLTRTPLGEPFAVFKSGQTQVAPLFVLIDNNDGAAERMATSLKANGQHRIVILAGGEAVLLREGRPGSLRQGSR